MKHGAFKGQHRVEVCRLNSTTVVQDGYEAGSVTPSVCRHMLTLGKRFWLPLELAEYSQQVLTTVKYLQRFYSMKCV